MTPPTSSPGRHMLRGSAWMIALRWSLRLAGIGSTVILVRLLTPHDFGIIAIAMMFVGLVETLGDTGERLALIRLPALDAAHYDTAFSLQLLVGIAVTLVLLLIAPVTVAYFHQPAAVAVIRLLSLRALLSGLENIGTIDFRRDFRFGTAYALAMGAKFASLVLTLLLAAWIRSYWALAIGILANQAAITILSYVLHRYRPRLSLARWRDISAFSFWTLLRSAGIYLSSQVDQFAVGGFAPAAALGRYAIAMDVATSPTAEIHEPVVSVLYPVLSKCRQDGEAIRALFLRVFGWSALICAATAAGLVCIAHDYRVLILGAQWSGAEKLIPWLALAASLSCLTGGADPVFDSLGRPSWSARLQWMRLLVLAIAVTGASLLWHTLEAVALARLAAVMVCAPVMLLAVARAVALPAAAYLTLLWRPVAAALVMGTGLMMLSPLLPAAVPLRLALEVPLGALLYGAIALLLWRLSGCGGGPEADLAAALQRALRWMRARTIARHPIGYL